MSVDERIASLEARISKLERGNAVNIRMGPREHEQTIVEFAPETSVDAAEVEQVDRSAQILTDGRPVPEDRSHVTLCADGQQQGYVVLTEAERGKGFVRPVRKTYIHVGLNPKMSGHILIKPGENGCGSRTTMGLSIAETYARDPGFYSGTFCCSCNAHRPLNEFFWEGTTGLVGS